MPSTRTEFSKHELALTLDWLADGFIIVDEAGTILFWNQTAVRIFGWREEEALGQQLADLIVPENFREAHRAGITHFLRTGEAPLLKQRYFVPGLRKDGSIATVSIRISAAKIPGKGYHFAALMSEATGRTEHFRPPSRLAAWWRRVTGGKAAGLET